MTTEDLITKELKKQSIIFEDNIVKSYNMFLSDLYLKEHTYKGNVFTVTDCDLVYKDELDYEHSKYNYSYEWEITVSLSLFNKIKLSYKDYYNTFIFNKDENYEKLEKMLEIESLIERELNENNSEV